MILFTSNMLRSIWNYFTKAADDSVSLDEAYNILNESSLPATDDQNITIADESLNIPLSNAICSTSGLITKHDPKTNTFTIDDKYSFESLDDRFTVGSKVTYDLLPYNNSVTNVNLLDELWNENVEKQSLWSNRTIVTKVEQKIGKTIRVEYEEMELNLDKIHIEFQPIVGDWIELDVKCEMDENVLNLCGKIVECTHIYPVRMHIEKGTITQWNDVNYTGTINQNIFFNRNSLPTGYKPQLKDRVVAEVIESNQNVCAWRAIKLIAENTNEKLVKIENPEPDVNLNTDHPDISIECDDLTFKKLKETQQFKISIRNTSEKVFIVKHVSFKKSSSQCRLFMPIPDYFHLLPSQATDILCECTSKSIGKTRELFIVAFDDFDLNKWVNITVNAVKPSSFDAYQRKTNNFIYQDRSNRNFVSGQRISAPPRFIKVNLDDFKVPDHLMRIVASLQGREEDLKEELCKIKFCLFSNLTFLNYLDKFHTALHLDEIHQLIAMENYTMSQACFIRSGDCLLLEINNLSEQRPSIILGDRVFASNHTNTDYEGVVHKLGANHVHLKFSSLFHDSYKGEDYAIRVVASRSSYKRAHNAIQFASRNLGKEILFPTRVEEKPSQIEGDSNGEMVWYNKMLNCYQQAAVLNAVNGVARPLPYVIYGPPGTGKTVTLIETILQIIRLIPQARLLVCAPSNSATDLLALRLIDSGVLRPGDLVRIVSVNHMSKNVIPEKLVPFCTVSMVAAKKGSYAKTEMINGMLIDQSSKVVGRHRITVTTCTSAGVLYTYGFPKGHFSHIIVDEAGQAGEPELMIPLVFLDSSRGQIILAGDPQQLGPICLSRIAGESGLQDSYLERLVCRFPYERDAEAFPKTGGYDPRLVTKLLFNYRSLDKLLKLTSSLFYNDDLIPTIFQENSEEGALLERVREMLPDTGSKLPPCIVFHSIKGENCRTEESPSWFNPDEAAQIFFYVNELYRLGLKASDIGIITPYIKQVQELRAVLTEAEFDIPKIGTVEDFQGQEYQVILMSTVRSSESFLEIDSLYALGFVSNPKRINVAISRAKTLLIIVGNSNLLCSDVHWRSVVKYCVENGAYTGEKLETDDF